MKVVLPEIEKVFKPITFSFILETKEDVIKIFCLFNHVKINNALTLFDSDWSKLRKFLTEEGQIEYSDYQGMFAKLNNIIK